METLTAPNLPPKPGLQFRDQMAGHLPATATTASTSHSDAVAVAVTVTNPSTSAAVPSHTSHTSHSRLDRHQQIHQQTPTQPQSQPSSQPQPQKYPADRMPPSHSRLESEPRFAPSPAVFRSYPPTFTAPAAASQESSNPSTTLQSYNETKPTTQSSLPSPQRKSSQTCMSAPTGRVRTPEEQHDTHVRTTQTNGMNHGEKSSPLGLVSPSMRHKRTASGLIKAPSLVSPILSNANLSSPLREKRGESVSSSGSRAGEAAAQLKTRLAYAMAKVQHGWQNHNIDQVEILASQLPSRQPASSPSAVLISPRSAMTNGASRLTMTDARQIQYPGSPHAVRSPPSKLRSGPGIVSWADAATIISPPSPDHRAHDSRTANGSVTGPSLAPAADIRPSTSSSTATVKSQKRPGGSLETTPTKQHARLPTTPRSKSRPHVPAHLRTTPTSHAQAEQEAIASLMLMHSPSGNAKMPPYPYQPHSSSQPSPRRNEIRHLDFPPMSASQPLAAMGSAASRSQGGSAGNITNGVRSPLSRRQTSESRVSASSDKSTSGLSQDGAAGRGDETKEDRERLLDEMEEGGA